MDFLIPHNDLSSEDKRECMEIMRDGNDLMKAWAEEFFGKKNMASRLRRGLFKWVADPKDSQAIDPEEVGIPQSVFDRILKVRTIESKLMFGHVRMVVSLARRFFWATSFSYLDMDDLVLEGLIALRDAVYSFSNEDANFTTYANWAIRRRLRRKIYRASDLGTLGESTIELLEQYHKQRRTLTKQFGYEPSRGTIIASMKLKSDQEERLEATFRRVVLSSTLQGDSEDGNRYENLGGNDRGPDLDMIAFERAIETASLTDMQRDLIRAAVRGEERFRSKIAEKYINPDTEKPYSRMSATNMLRKAYELVAREMVAA